MNNDIQLRAMAMDFATKSDVQGIDALITLAEQIYVFLKQGENDNG